MSYRSGSNIPYAIEPSFNGLLAWTLDAAIAGTNITPAAATIMLTKIPIPKTITIANLIVVCSTAGTNYTNTQMGVYNSSGTLIGASGVMASAGTNTFGSLGALTIPITVIGGQSLTVSGSPTAFVWGALHMGTNNATAVIVRGSPPNAATANAGLAAASFRSATQTGHGTNTLQTIGNLTPANNVSANFPMFIGVT